MMRSPIRIILVGYLLSCLIAGLGTVYLRVVNEPTEFESATVGFNLPYALEWFVFGALFLGVRVFAVGAMLVAIGYFAAYGLRRLRKR